LSRIASTKPQWSKSETDFFNFYTLKHVILATGMIMNGKRERVGRWRLWCISDYFQQVCIVTSKQIFRMKGRIVASTAEKTGEPRGNLTYRWIWGGYRKTPQGSTPSPNLLQPVTFPPPKSRDNLRWWDALYLVRGACNSKPEGRSHPRHPWDFLESLLVAPWPAESALLRVRAIFYYLHLGYNRVYLLATDVIRN
jgi:hypothetical protein